MRVSGRVRTVFEGCNLLQLAKEIGDLEPAAGRRILKGYPNAPLAMFHRDMAGNAQLNTANNEGTSTGVPRSRSRIEVLMKHPEKLRSSILP